jgi:LCP family protein required for cell wall assembly
MNYNYTQQRVPKTSSWIFKKTAIIVTGLVCIRFVIKSSGYLIDAISTTQNTIRTQTTNIISSTIGSSMKKDIGGNINILFVWYGWKKHQWWFLADSIIIASFDPQEYSISMISIPRDLIVNSSWYINRINTIMAYSYNKNKDLDFAIQKLWSKINQITDLDIPYYVLIDFDGFVDIIKKIGGIDVYIPKKVYDTTYPWPNYSYTTFSINSGQQILDGELALKYVRSRHSSSDFSRSQRQQVIIKSLIQKLIGWWLSITTIRNIYETYRDYVETNITLDEIIWLLAYGKTIPRIHNFWLTMECSNNSRKTMQPWCLLYPIDSSQFWWISWLLPIWANIGKISYYELIQNFSNLISHNQWYLNENTPIHIYNSTNNTTSKKPSIINQQANNLWTRLKRYGFNIQKIDNALENLTGTTIIITWTWEYKKTISTLRNFFTIDAIEINPATVNLSGEILPNSIDIYIGSDFTTEFGGKPFNFYLSDAQ